MMISVNKLYINHTAAAGWPAPTIDHLHLKVITIYDFEETTLELEPGLESTTGHHRFKARRKDSFDISQCWKIQ